MSSRLSRVALIGPIAIGVAGNELFLVWLLQVVAAAGGLVHGVPSGSGVAD